MYNDYYLQEISNKITTTNTKLDTIISNQTILHNDLATISTNQATINNSIYVGIAILAIILLYKFIERCFR